MKDYLHNKATKDRKLCEIIKRAINLDRKRQALTWDDIANELGVSGGTLENKLKPSYDNGDVTVTELVHLLELSADYTPLEYIAKKFDLVLVPRKEAHCTTDNIHSLCDKANFENSDVFKSVKQALEDGVITTSERDNILKEIDESERASAELREQIKNLEVQE